MKKKHLLNESEVRKMMKFANLKGLSDGFVDKLQEGHYGMEEELYEEADEELEADPMAAAGEMSPADSGEALPGEEDLAVDAAIDDAEATPEAVATAIIQGALDAAAEFGVSGTVEDEGGLDAAEAPLEDEEEDGLDAAEAPLEDEEPLEEMLNDAGFSLHEDDDVVNEVARRVAKRLMEMKRRA